MEEKEYTKHNRQKWQKENKKNLTVSIAKEKEEKFKLIAENHGTTRGELINRWIDEYIEEHEDELNLE